MVHRVNEARDPTADPPLEPFGISRRKSGCLAPNVDPSRCGPGSRRQTSNYVIGGSFVPPMHRLAWLVGAHASGRHLSPSLRDTARHPIGAAQTLGTLPLAKRHRPADWVSNPSQALLIPPARNRAVGLFRSESRQPEVVARHHETRDLGPWSVIGAPRTIKSNWPDHHGSADEHGREVRCRSSLSNQHRHRP